MKAMSRPAQRRRVRQDRADVAKASAAGKVLVVDVGGTSVKILASGQNERRSFPSGPTLTPKRMVSEVKKLAGGWRYDVVSIGYPGPVLRARPVAEPHNLGRGWVGFDFVKAFGVPVKIINDAAMQALGTYRGGRMLFLGLGTGLGSALIVNSVLEPLELAHLPYKNAGSFEQQVGAAALERLDEMKERMRMLVGQSFRKVAVGSEVLLSAAFFEHAPSSKCRVQGGSAVPACIQVRREF